MRGSHPSISARAFCLSASVAIAVPAVIWTSYAAAVARRSSSAEH
ncbi:hypothetical protein ACSNOI_01840 [Actinomadura kijaniata]